MSIQEAEKEEVAPQPAKTVDPEAEAAFTAPNWPQNLDNLPSSSEVVGWAYPTAEFHDCRKYNLPLPTRHLATSSLEAEHVIAAIVLRVLSCVTAARAVQVWGGGGLKYEE